MSHLLVCTGCTIGPAALVLVCVSVSVCVCVCVCVCFYSTSKLPVRSAMSSHSPKYHTVNRMTASQEQAAGSALVTGLGPLQLPCKAPALLPTGGCQCPPLLVALSRGRRTPLPPSIQPGRHSWAMAWLAAADIAAAGSGTAATCWHFRAL